MSNNDWVQEGTPHDSAEWTEEADDYGVPVEPTEWDDYSSEQAMPAPNPPAQPETPEQPVLPETPQDGASDESVAERSSLPTAPDPDDAVAGEDQPVSTVELGETPEEITGAAAQDDDVPGTATVFEDDRPVDTADEDLTREVSEWIDDERLGDTGATIVDDNELPEAQTGTETHDDEYLDDERPGDTGATRVDDDEPTTVRGPEESSFGRPSGDADATTSLAAVAAATGGAAGASAGGLAAPGMAGLYRTDADETQVLDTTAERRSLADEAAEEEARAAALRAEKEERDRRLGMVQTSQANAEREMRPRRRGVGGFGSFGLFVLRLITAGVLGILAYQVLYSIDDTADFLAGQPLIPEPRLVAWIVGFTLAAMAVMLVIGLGVRVVGVLLTALAVATLVLVRWGSFSPFVEGMEGFLGDKDLLLAGIGVLFLSLGGGRFGIDGAIHRSREDAREARRS
ncbi:DoxX family membrane protein [Tessaracoccus sp. MC1865]|uniref:DoxX family protein n=1 Tax=Tessaracoccus sp. MC1865 TaxID=2760310 RepID=UPI0015FFF24B|nr:DoxX family membrane protein [Tessaracoccus sp. MC1865]MBB1484039.1 DoxX family membrane protein [Tessaracoccus sp. MC1865]QTO37076.1 DoxX family membrane protein [Tessaracoccus sp. MC1865]